MALNHDGCLFASMILIILPFFLHLVYASASTLSIPRQTITDSPNDWKYFSATPRSNCTNLQGSIQIPDMTGVSYFSDGDTLNATIWLSGPFQETPVPLLRFPQYSMTIGIIQPNDIVVESDYSSSLQWDATNSTWKLTIDEYLANGTMSWVQDNDYENFFDNTGNKGHINLSLDLDRISSPDQYLLLFSVMDGIVEAGNICTLVDFTENTLHMPPPRFSMSAFPSPLEITQGEEKTIELKINSTAIGSPFVRLNTQQIPPGMNVTIEPDKTFVPAAGVATSHVKVKVSDRITPASYTFPIYSNITFPIAIDASSFLNSSITENENQAGSRGNASSITTQGIPVSAIQLSPRPSYFSVVVKPYLFEEQFKDFWDTYGGLIGLVGGGFAAGISALLIDRFKNRRSKSWSRKLDEW